MVIKSCFQCEVHYVKQGEKEQMSYCRKENCWSRFSKCIVKKAIESYLEQESSDGNRPFSALAHLYSSKY
jgi:hypothetical protein